MSEADAYERKSFDDLTLSQIADLAKLQARMNYGSASDATTALYLVAAIARHLDNHQLPTPNTPKDED